MEIVYPPCCPVLLPPSIGSSLLDTLHPSAWVGVFILELAVLCQALWWAGTMGNSK